MSEAQNTAIALGRAQAAYDLVSKEFAAAEQRLAVIRSELNSVGRECDRLWSELKNAKAPASKTAGGQP